jgi:uncharacterized membrane protein
MSVKSAALLALVGTGLLTLVLLVRLVMDGWSLFNGAISAGTFFAALVYALTGVSQAVFFWVFQRARV